ncbi:hypothetical protein ACLOJK_009724 [Asimina triloba]
MAMEKAKSFPDDILIEILCRLPKKSLFRFKCVSKQWLTLISNRNSVFPKTTHLGLVCQSYLLLKLRPKASHTEYLSETNFLHLHSNGTASCLITLSHFTGDSLLLSSCNGFLLYRQELTRKGKFDYMVCHPATMRSWFISRPRDLHWVHMGLASDGHHFKLLLFSAYRTHFPTRARYAKEVYSSENEEWSVEEWDSSCRTMIPRRPKKAIDSGRSVFHRGAFYWVWRNKLVICHLVGNKDCEFIKLPRFLGEVRRHEVKKNQCIWVSRGFVNCCQVTAIGHRIGIWSLHEGTGWWWDRHDGILAPPPMVGVEKSSLSFAPLAFNDDFEIVYLMFGRGIFSYNLATKETKEACKSPFEGSDDRAYCTALPFLSLTQFDIA